MSDNHVLYVERYRPKKIDECILPIHLKETFKGFIQNKNIPNLILSGSAGIGKTTVARALADELNYDFLFINGSNEGKLLDTLRNKIQQFTSSKSLVNKRKLVLIDEGDQMPEAVQTALRAFIESVSMNCSFIITCNYRNRIIAPLASRFSDVEFTLPKKETASLQAQYFKRMKSILDENSIEYDPTVLAKVVSKNFPDFRKTLNNIQKYSSRGKIDEGIFSSMVDMDMKNIMGMLKSRNFRDTRLWVSSVTVEMPQLVRGLYDALYEYVQPASIPDAVLILNKYQYQHAFVVDPEINIMAMMTELMSELEWK